MLNEIEREILQMLVAGDHADLACLREQLARATVERREMTGVGFFTFLRVPDEVPRLVGQRNVVISDVYATVTGLEHDAGFALFVREGALDVLESFIVDDRWTESATLQRAFYVRHPNEATAALVETAARDLSMAMPSPALNPAGLRSAG